MPIEVEDRDLGFAKLQKELLWLQGKSVTIGWQGASALETPGETEATIVDIATFQEFGTVKIPERPMLRSVFDEKAAEMEAFIEKELGAVLDLKRTGKVALNRIGMKAVSLVQQRIREANRWAVPLAGSTIRQKGRQELGPGAGGILIDTGRMLASVTYAIREGDTIIEEGKAA